jgi:hypothetical protein
MGAQFNLPQYKTVLYRINQETGYYTKTQEQPLKTPVMRLPYELKRTPARSEKIKCNAKELLVSKEMTKTKNYKFLTGLQETNFENWFLGNDYEMENEVKVISIILFHFTDNNTGLTVYYFSQYDKGKTDLRLKFANEIIPHLLNIDKN